MAVGKKGGDSPGYPGSPSGTAVPATPGAHLLPHILFKLLLGSFHFPQVMELSSHLSMGKPRLLPSFLLSQGYSRFFISTPRTFRPLPEIILPDPTLPKGRDSLPHLES